MKIAQEEVLRIAELSKLRFSDEELANITARLQDKVDLTNALQKVNVEGVKPTTHILSTVNVLREDEVVKPMDREILLANAPSSDSSAIIVPRVVE